MGPQLCSCGNKERRPGTLKNQTLQWGRNFAVAETVADVLDHMRADLASMGPQLCSCGNIKLCVFCDGEFDKLQWGRNFAVAETGDSYIHSRIIHRLQWGRNFAVAETSHRRFLPSRVSVASMGPQLCSCGNYSNRPYKIGYDSLQWGRNFAVAETSYPIVSLTAPQGASMGPQLCSCGNPTAPAA